MSKHEKVKELTQKLSELRDRKDKLSSEAEDLAEKRDKLDEHFKSLRAEILTLRDERDKINQKVKELKQKRSDTTTKTSEKIEELKKINQEIDVLSEKRPSKSLQALQEEFEDTEWKIQTSSLSLDEEKELVEEARQLEIQLSVRKKLQKLSDKAFVLKTETRALGNQGKLCHEELTKNAQKSQETHQKMLEKIDESKKIKSEADNLHKDFLQAREKIKPLQNEIYEIINQMKKSKTEIREEEEKEKKEGEDAIRTELEKQAREKLKRGEKLSWEEFQILTEKGMSE